MFDFALSLLAVAAVILYAVRLADGSKNTRWIGQRMNLLYLGVVSILGVDCHCLWQAMVPIGTEKQ